MSNTKLLATDMGPRYLEYIIIGATGMGKG